MNLLTRIFGDRKEAAEETYECHHSRLQPRWDRVEDIGHEDRATHFACEGCAATFSPEEASELRSAALARLRN